MIHGHGNDRYNYNKKIIADFSSNVWYKGPAEKLITHLKTHLSHIAHYPEPGAEKLQAKTAGFYNLHPEQCLITNGSVEAFYLIALANRTKQSVVLTPCFSEYEDACHIHGHKLKFISNKEGWQNKIKGNELVWLGNPNNPDGKVWAAEKLEKIIASHADKLFVVDEAYGDLCHSFQSVVPLIKKFQNLIVVHSFTKNFAIPGLRLGFILGSKKTIKPLNHLRMPWTVNSIAQEAGNYIIDHYDTLIPKKEEIKEASKLFLEELDDVKEYLKVFPTDCNYFLVQLKGKYSEELKSKLMNEYGLLIRDASNFRGLDKSYIRLAVQKPQHNKLLIKAMKTSLKNLYYG